MRNDLEDNSREFRRFWSHVLSSLMFASCMICIVELLVGCDDTRRVFSHQRVVVICCDTVQSWRHCPCVHISLCLLLSLLFLPQLLYF